MAGPARQDLPLWKGSTLPGFLPRANEVIRAVNDLKDRPGLPVQVFTTRPRGGGDSGTWVRLSTYTASGQYYNGVGQEPNGVGGTSDVSPVQNYTVFAVGNRIGIELGAVVLIRPNGTLTSSVGALPSGTAVYSFPFVEPRATFAVKVTKVGGTAGPPSAWTYDVTSVDGHVIASAVSPELRRPSGVATTFPSAGTIGVGYWDAAGTFHLWDANESC